MKTGNPRRRSIPVLALGLLLCQPGLPTTAGDSLVMPLASESLLLDIVAVDDHLVAAGERGHVLVSNDAGANWRQAQVPTRQMLTGLDFPTPERGWAVGHDGLILNSIDGGSSWVVQRDGLVDQREQDQQRLTHLNAEVETVKASLLAAADRPGRERLQARLDDLAMEKEDLEFALENPVFAPPLLDVYFADQLRGVAVGAFNTLLLTDDGGLSWRSASELLPNPEGMHLNAVVGDGKLSYWVAAEGGLLFRSRDGGRSWQQLDSPTSASWFGISRAEGSGVLLAFGLRGQVYRSTDDGETWRGIPTGVQRSLAGGDFLSDRYVVLVGAVGVLLLSDDGGLSFSAQPIERRVGLAAVAGSGGRVVAVGQGGIHIPSGVGGE